MESGASSSKITLTEGLSTAVINLAGGRLESLEYHGHEVLETKARQTGNTFWTSPQADWSWPPVPEHDSLDYQVEAESNGSTALLIQGKPDATLGFAIAKSWRWVEDGLLEIVYRIRNHGSATRRVAPWEITRVPPGGTSFFASGDPALTRGDLPLSREGEFTFFRHRGEDQKKAFAASPSGWLAHAGADTVLLKVFPAVEPEESAPGEAVIELFGAFDYVEVEQQGHFIPLPAGKAMEWRILWKLLPRKDLPADEAAMAGELGAQAAKLAETWLI